MTNIRGTALATIVVASLLSIPPVAFGQPRTTVPVSTITSTVPQSLTRAETAAEDVIGFLEHGQVAKSKAEARILRRLAYGPAADVLRRSGVSAARIRVFQQRADRTARLSTAGSSALAVSQAANDVSQLMPGFYARFRDPVPATVLALDYLDRQVQLDVRAGQNAKLGATVRRLEASWQQLRPQLIKAGGAALATCYDRHVNALKRGGTASTMERAAVSGLSIVDKMETVFLHK